MPASRILRWRARALRHRRFGHEERACRLPRCEAAEVRRVSATCAGCRARVAAGEHETEALVRRSACSRGLLPTFRSVRIEPMASSKPARQWCFSSRCASRAVDRWPGDARGRDPRRGFSGAPCAGQLLERDHHGVWTLPPRGRNLRDANEAREHETRSSRNTRSTARPRLPRIQSAERPSTGRRVRRATGSGESRSNRALPRDAGRDLDRRVEIVAFDEVVPTDCSLVSANGPSVTTTSPLRPARSSPSPRLRAHRRPAHTALGDAFGDTAVRVGHRLDRVRIRRQAFGLSP